MSKFIEALLCLSFNHQLQMKMYHFQTLEYGAHKAVDSYLSKFTDNLDKFMEVAQGIFGKFKIKYLDIKFETLNDQNIVENLNKFINILRNCDQFINTYTELTNIRDEMVGDINQLKYLLTFK